MSDRDNFSPAVKKEIGSWSNWHCMICNKAVVKKRRSSIAHIIPASKNGPRSEYFDVGEYDETFRKSNRNGLLLCATHHIEIDNDDEEIYSLDQLFEINNRFREQHEFENMVSNELYSGNKADDTVKAAKNLLVYLNVSDDDFSKELKSNYKETIENKIDLNVKLEKNNFNNATKRKITMFTEYEGLRFYSALTHTTEEIGNHYFLTAISVLYKKQSKKKSEQDKYNNMLKILKTCCKELNVDEVGLLNYYFYICEVFIK